MRPLTDNFPELSEDEACDRLLELHFAEKAARRQNWRDNAHAITQVVCGITLLSITKDFVAQHQANCDFTVNQNVLTLMRQGLDEAFFYTKALGLLAVGVTALIYPVLQKNNNAVDDIRQQKDHLLKHNAKWFAEQPKP